MNKYELYEYFVQDPAFEIDFLTSRFKRLRGRKPLSLREDFCGTGWLSCEWVKQSPHHTAIGIDLDPEPIRSGKERHFATLQKDEKTRMSYRRENVLTCRQKADIIVGLNFSYWFFHQRKDLLRYFRAVRASLPGDGAFLIDTMGGFEAFQPCIERRRGRGVTYQWECERFDPITSHGFFSIHFKPRNRPVRKRVFTYDWRCWTIPETRELLKEAGFSQTIVSWEGDDGKGGGNGLFRSTTRAEDSEVWTAYLLSLP